MTLANQSQALFPCQLTEQDVPVNPNMHLCCYLHLFLSGTKLDKNEAWQLYTAVLCFGTSWFSFLWWAKNEKTPNLKFTYHLGENTVLMYFPRTLAKQIIIPTDNNNALPPLPIKLTVMPFQRRICDCNRVQIWLSCTFICLMTDQWDYLS